MNMRCVASDQAGMACGISGDTKKARALYEAAIAKDPDYPLYYYNLVCADAQENRLADARTHLQRAFERKANVIPGEPCRSRPKTIPSCHIATTKAFGNS